MKDAVRIRRAVLKDLESMLAVEAGFGDESFSRRQMRYLIMRARGAVFVAERQGAVVGYVAALIRKNSHGRIYSIAVAPACRGLGIASALLDEAVRFLASVPVANVFLEVAADNSPALSLYIKKGFTIRKKMARYYHNGGDAYSMVRPLP